MIKSFKELNEKQKIEILVNLIENNPCLRGSQLTLILKSEGYVDIEKTYLNSFLHSHDEIFNSNRIDSQDAPKWATRKSQNKCSEMNVDFEKNLYLWQKEALSNWRNNGKKGYIVASRRSGKTYLAKFVAYEHALNHGPVIVSVQNRVEINDWFESINELKKKYQFKINIRVMWDGMDELIEKNTILLGTNNDLNRIENITKSYLLVVEHIDVINLERFYLLNKNFESILGLSNIVDDSSSFKKRIDKYFKKMVFQYSVTDAMLNDEVQSFSLKFIPVKFIESESIKYIEYLSNFNNFKSNSTESSSIDVYYEVDHYNRGKDPGFIYLKSLYDFIDFFQGLEGKLQFLERKMYDFKKFNKILIFCESPRIIRHIKDHLQKKGLSFIVHSKIDNLTDISSPLEDWKNQKVLLSDHIKNIGEVDMGNIDYVLIFGTLGNSSRLTRKFEAFLQHKNTKIATEIEVLYAENTLEDPLINESAYLEYKDYLLLTTSVLPVINQRQGIVSKIDEITVEVKEVIMDEIDYKSLNILVINGDRLFEFSEEVCLELNLNNDSIQFIKVANNEVISFIYESAQKGIYSDILVAKEIIDEDNENITLLSNVKHVNIKIHNKKFLSLTNFIQFLNESFKYNFGRGN